MTRGELVTRPVELPEWLEALIARAEAAGRPITSVQLLTPVVPAGPPPPLPPAP